MSQWITKLTQKLECWAAERAAVYWLASHYYRTVIQKEIDLANITERDHILCIGGGVCPFSAILLHQATGAKVTVIDNDSTCIPKAQQAIARLGIGGHVQVLLQDGGSAQLPFAEYSVVHFALQVCPMEHVFSHVERQVVPGTKLLVRRPKAQLHKLYSQLSNALLPCCRQVAHRARNIGSTLLYIKQKRHHEEKTAAHGPAGALASARPVAA